MDPETPSECSITMFPPTRILPRYLAIEAHSWPRADWLLIDPLNHVCNNGQGRPWSTKSSVLSPQAQLFLLWPWVKSCPSSFCALSRHTGQHGKQTHLSWAVCPVTRIKLCIQSESLHIDSGSELESVTKVYARDMYAA